MYNFNLVWNRLSEEETMFFPGTKDLDLAS